MTLRVLLPHRSPNYLRTAGRTVSAVLFWLWRAFVWMVRWTWEILTILCGGGSYGKWVEWKFPHYYHSKHWNRIREKAIEHVHGRCEVCGYDYQSVGRELTVRHRHYYHNGKSVFKHEKPERDLVVLCEFHNQRGHHVHAVESWQRAYRWYGVLLK